MPAVTGSELIGDAFGILNVFLPGESVSSSDENFALRTMNRMLNQWNQRAQFIPVISRERFAMVADQGGPDDPYTIGPGGDWDTERPSNQNSIASANLILTTTSPEVRVPLGIYADQAYDANQIPGMSNTQPTGLYYNPTYDDDLGSVFLWPVPSVDYNEIELFLEKAIPQFSTASATYFIPDGAPEAIVYNLAKRLQGPYGRAMTQADNLIAIESLGVFKRSNTKLSDVMNDAYWASSRRTLYNINTGSGG